MNNIRRNAGILAITMLCSMNAVTVHAMEKANHAMDKAKTKIDNALKDEDSRSTEALWKLGKCFAVWGATGVAVGGAYWLNNQLGTQDDPGYFTDATMGNLAFASSLSGLLAGIDLVADNDVKTVTEQTILRVPVIMATQHLMSRPWVHKALRKYSPVLKDVLVCNSDRGHDAHECALKAATLGTLLYVTAIRPGLNHAWNYGKDRAWEVKDWVLGTE